MTGARRTKRHVRISARLDSAPPALQHAIAALLHDASDAAGRTLAQRAAAAARRVPGASAAQLAELYLAAALPKRPGVGIEPVPLTPVAPAEVANLLGADGPFARSLSTYEFRGGQISMACAVTEAFNNGQHLMAEGGTGIGKSLAYLVPALLWAQANQVAVVISTNTKNLQAQLFHKDIPLIRKTLQIDFNAALIKGRLNYLCLRKLLAAVFDPDGVPTDRRLDMTEMLLWSLDTGTGDLSECPAWTPPVAAGLGSLLTATGEECLSRGCRYARRCFLLRARGIALTADIVVANHALVFAEMGLQSPALPPYTQIVFDEAHNLEEVATRHFAVELSQPRFRFELGRLWRKAPERDGFGVIPALLRQARSGSLPGPPEDHRAIARQCWTVTDALRRLDEALTPLFDALATQLPSQSASVRYGPGQPSLTATDAITRAQTHLGEQLKQVAAEIRALAGQVRELDTDGLPFHAEALHDIEGALLRIEELQADMLYVLRGDDPASVFWVEPAPPRQGHARAWAAPIDVGARLASDLYAQKASVVFSSATLSVAGSCDFLKRRIGLHTLSPEALVEHRAPSPFDYGSQCSIMVPEFIEDPAAHDGYAEQLGLLLADVFRRTRGRGLALFTSYRMLRDTAEVVEAELADSGIQVLAQGKSGSRGAITRAFTEDVTSVLLGTHSFWEGVDAVGETLSCLVVARLPFAVFTDPIVAARCEQIEQEGRSAFMDFSLPNAVIRFRQGFGRLIRHRRDRGIVIVADRRVVTKRYGAWFQRSLPAPTRRIPTREALLDAVDAFLDAAGQ